MKWVNPEQKLSLHLTLYIAKYRIVLYIYVYGVLVIFYMDHTKIHTIGGHPFLTSCHIISCVKMVTLENYVQASNDDIFKRIQKTTRFNYIRHVDEPDCVDKFLTLRSENSIFVDTWDKNKLNPSTMKLYSKKTSAREASRKFLARVMSQVNETYQIKIEA